MSWCLGGESRPGFTLVEVLIVIVVISLLIAVIGLVGVKVVHGQRVALTEMTMKNVKIAIDRFAELDPLKNIYDRKDHVTFGPYPAYQLAGCAGTCVSGVLEPAGSLEGDYALANRFHRDLGNRVGNVGDWVSWGTVDPNDANNDIRALYTYLRLYAPDALSQVPSASLKKLTSSPEYVNPTGTGPAPGQVGSAWVDILGIYDAWGVPLDYFLYVKLEWDGITGLWRVTQRIPVLRSWGISYDEYMAEINGNDAPDPDKWIFSDPFPSPAAAAVNWRDGTLNGTGAPVSGWARAIGAGDLAIVDDDRTHSFGYVP